MKHCISAVLLLVLAMSSHAQRRSARPAAPVSARAEAFRLHASSEIGEELARWRRTPMPFTGAALSARERQLVNKLVEAQHALENIYWRQSDPEGLRLLLQLRASKNPTDEKVVRLLMIHGSRFDLLENNKPFVGTQPFFPGHGLYPDGLTRDEVEQYVAAHPDKKAEIYSPYTIVRRPAAGELAGIPYRIAFREFLEPAARVLREAAALSDDSSFARFLRLRADALLSDDYYASDIAWLELDNPKFDIICAPYETYLDDLLGVKTSFGGAVLVRNAAESQKLAVYQQYVADIQDALPLPAEDRPSVRGHLTPMEVMDTPFRSGDLRHGYQAVADNLPNDPRIHQEKGTKKIFFKNFMDARVNYVILPIARRLMRPDQAPLATGEGYMAGTLMHEISHGLGPAFARRNGQQVDIREAIGPAYSGLEEAKADIVGLFGLKWLVDHGAFPPARLAEIYISHVAGIFRTVRFGIAEAHGKAEMMEFNYFSEQNVIQRDAGGHYFVDVERMPVAVASLARELLEQEATGDRARAEAWFAKYDHLPTELQQSLRQVRDIPVDLDPVFSFPEPIR